MWRRGEPSCTVGHNPHMNIQQGEQYGGSFQNYHRNTLGVSNPIPGCKPEENQIFKRHRNPCNLSPTRYKAKSEKQANCRNHSWYTVGHMYTMHYFSTIKKQEILPSPAAGKDACDDHSKGSKGDRDRHVSYDITSRCNRKTDSNELHYKGETDSQTQKRNLQLPKMKCGGCAGSKQLVQNNNTPYEHLIHLRTGAAAAVQSLSPV